MLITTFQEILKSDPKLSIYLKSYALKSVHLAKIKHSSFVQP